MTEIQFGLSALVRFITASLATRRKRILADYKTADRPFDRYRDARRILWQFRDGEHDVAWLGDQADTLADSLHLSLSPNRLEAIRDNIERIQKYAAQFAGRTIVDEKPIPPLTYSHSDLIVKIRPDVFGTERGHDRLILFWFSKPSTDPERQGKILAQIVFEATVQGNLGLSRSAVRIWDCFTGEVYSLTGPNIRLRAEIEARCEEIVALWPTI